MDRKSNLENQQQQDPIKGTSAREEAAVDTTPSVYYNSEPSSQPPTYPDQSVKSQSKAAAPPNTSSASRPSNTHRGSVPASTIHAISPYVDLDAERRAARKNKTMRERWRDFRERNFTRDTHEDVPGEKNYSTYSSGPQLNVFGASLKGGLVTPYQKKGGKR